MNIERVRLNMERLKLKSLNLITMVLTFLAVVPKMESQIRPPAVAPRPLCASQFALANYACARLPFSPGSPPEPPPSPPSPDDDDEGHRNNHRHSHRHHNHRHGHHHRQGPEEEECCRWAKEVDSQCVCELLVRLPPFLMRPLHQYSLVIGEDCKVSYSCGAPI